MSTSVDTYFLSTHCDSQKHMKKSPSWVGDHLAADRDHQAFQSSQWKLSHP